MGVMCFTQVRTWLMSIVETYGVTTDYLVPIATPLQFSITCLMRNSDIN